MIEVVFAESEGAAMKVAKSFDKDEFLNGKVVDMLLSGEPLDGETSEVIYLPLMLDVGDISVPVNSDYRKKLIIDMYTLNDNDEEFINDLEEAWTRYTVEIDRLKDYASKGKDIRIWYSEAPYSICGFYYVCSLLKDYNCNIYGLRLPSFMEISEDEIQSLVSWGEVGATMFYRFTPLQKKLSPSERQGFASIWQELTTTKSMLRAVVNGTLIEVPEDFYDCFIRKEIPEGEFIMARVIENLITKYSLGVGDWWYARRIMNMINSGELKIVKHQKSMYGSVISKA